MLLNFTFIYFLWKNKKVYKFFNLTSTEWVIILHVLKKNSVFIIICIFRQGRAWWSPVDYQLQCRLFRFLTGRWSIRRVCQSCPFRRCSRHARGIWDRSSRWSAKRRWRTHASSWRSSSGLVVWERDCRRASSAGHAKPKTGCAGVP